MTAQLEEAHLGGYEVGRSLGTSTDVRSGFMGSYYQTYPSGAVGHRGANAAPCEGLPMSIDRSWPDAP